MKTKIFPLVLSLALVFGFVGFTGVKSANAQTATFPAGCSSALGYSVTTGLPCNGNSTATTGPLPGCSTALGYSIINGEPCSGGDIAISFLAGCSSIYGYSTITAQPCNGTAVAVILPVNTGGGVVYYPGFPSTGYGGSVSNNILLLAVSGLVASLGLVYATRPRTEY